MSNGNWRLGRPASLQQSCAWTRYSWVFMSDYNTCSITFKMKLMYTSMANFDRFHVLIKYSKFIKMSGYIGIVRILYYKVNSHQSCCCISWKVYVDYLPSKGSCRPIFDNKNCYTLKGYMELIALIRSCKQRLTPDNFTKWSLFCMN